MPQGTQVYLCQKDDSMFFRSYGRRFVEEIDEYIFDCLKHLCKFFLMAAGI